MMLAEVDTVTLEPNVRRIGAVQVLAANARRWRARGLDAAGWLLYVAGMAAKLPPFVDVDRLPPVLQAWFELEPDARGCVAMHVWQLYSRDDNEAC